MCISMFNYFIILLLCFATVIAQSDDDILEVKLKIPKKTRAAIECPPVLSFTSELFPLPCSSHDDCKIMGSKYLCCPLGIIVVRRCIMGVKVAEKIRSPPTTTKLITTTSTTTTSTSTTTTTPPSTTTVTISSARSSSSSTLRPKMSLTLVCPFPENIPYSFFRFPCTAHKDCSLLGDEYTCCKTLDEGNYCTKGIVKRKSKLSKKNTRKDSEPEAAKIILTSTGATKSKITQKNSVENGLQDRCPKTINSVELFPLPCKRNADCSLMGSKYICCPHNGGKYCISMNDGNHESPELLQSIRTPEIATKPYKIQSADVTAKGTEKFLSNIQILTLYTTTTEKITSAVPTFATKPLLTTSVRDVKTSKPKSQKSSNIKSDVQKCLRSPEDRFVFGLSCKDNNDCPKPYKCCQKACVQTADRTKRQKDEENLITDHRPILGLIPRECPKNSFGELLFNVKNCEKDSDCWPRICCPDGKKKYCKTAMPRLDMFRLTENIAEPFQNVAGYLQCSKPLGKGFGKSKECETSLDCLPNLCCREGSKKFCRPPEKSIIGYIAGTAAFASAERLRNLGR